MLSCKWIRGPTLWLNLVEMERNEEDDSDLLSPNSLVSATSEQLCSSSPTFQMPGKHLYDTQS